MEAKADDLSATENPSANAAAQAVADVGEAVSRRHNASATSATANAAKASGEASANGSQALCADPAAAAAAREMGRKAVAGVMRSIDATVVRSLRAAAQRISGDDLFAATFAEQVRLPNSEAENIGELTITVCEKHGVRWLEWLPEFSLVWALGTYGFNVANAVRNLSTLNKEKQQRSTAQAQAL